MQPRNFEQRLTFLEQQMQELRELPDRVERMESQILQLRTEMKDGPSAIRAAREEIRMGAAESRSLARRLHAERMQALSALEAVIRNDVITRLDQLLEGQRGASG